MQSHHGQTSARYASRLAELLTRFLDFADTQLSDAVELFAQLVSHLADFLTDACSALQRAGVDDLAQELRPMMEDQLNQSVP